MVAFSNNNPNDLWLYPPLKKATRDLIQTIHSGVCLLRAGGNRSLCGEPYLKRLPAPY